MTLLDQAQELASKGYHVFPVVVTRDEREKKHLNFQELSWTNASTDPDKINAMPWRLATHIVIACEPSDIAVLDHDSHVHNDRPVMGEHLTVKWSAHVSELGQEMPDVPLVPTQSGGAHQIYRQNSESPVGGSAKKLTSFTDTRGLGGIIIAWKPDRLQAVENLPEIPKWVADYSRKAKGTQRAERVAQTFPDGSDGTQWGVRGATAEIEAIRDHWNQGETGEFNDFLYGRGFHIGQLVGGGQLSDEFATSLMQDLLDGLDPADDCRIHDSGMRSIQDGIAFPRVPKARKAELSDIELGRVKDLATFILDEPDTIPAIWGSQDDVLWAEGEILMVAGQSGTGKTTLAQQVVLARLGILEGELLGQPIQPENGTLVYLAMDRPRQAARSFKRMVVEAQRETLRPHVVWRGQIPVGTMASRSGLAEFVEHLSNGDKATVVVDSLKDLVSGLSDDERASSANHALQELVDRKHDVVVLHHGRKAGMGERRGKSLDDVYGSTWLTAGMGSVLLVEGEPGAEEVTLWHVKQPARQLGPLNVTHDHITGRSFLGRSDESMILEALSFEENPPSTVRALQAWGQANGYPRRTEFWTRLNRLRTGVSDPPETPSASRARAEEVM